jgi:thymidylate synthase (FAD)
MKVELLNVMGDDLMVVNTARVSYGKEVAEFTDKDEKLLNFLATHGHWSPFSHPQLSFRIECPIYVERQLVKTEAGRVYNSISGRYVDFSDTYTTIGKWRKQSKDSKQGSEGLVDDQSICSLIEMRAIEYAKACYDELLENGVSKEQARSVLPLNLNTTMIWTGSLYSLIRLCQQRLKPDAQKETGDVVRAMLEETIKIGMFNHSLKAYGL